MKAAATSPPISQDQSVEQAQAKVALAQAALAKSMEEQEAAVAKEEEASASMAESKEEEERSEETAKLHLQLTIEQSYFDAFKGKDGQVYVDRRAYHVANIQWFKHSITNLKAPTARVVVLTTAVATNEKKLIAAGVLGDELKVTMDAAIGAHSEQMAVIEKYASEFACVKQDLEVAQADCAASTAAKQEEPKSVASSLLVESCPDEHKSSSEQHWRSVSRSRHRLCPLIRCTCMCLHQRSQCCNRVRNRWQPVHRPQP